MEEKENIPGQDEVKTVSLGEVIQRMDKQEQVEVLNAIGGVLAEILEEGEKCSTCSLEGDVVEGLEAITEDETMCEEYLAAKRVSVGIELPDADDAAFLKWHRDNIARFSKAMRTHLGKLILKDISQTASQRNNSTDPRFRQKGKGKTGYLTRTPNHRHRIHRGRRS